MPSNRQSALPVSLPDSISVAALRAAVARGVITQQQLEALLAEAGHAESARSASEAPHALNAVSVAYYLGAAAVVFALVWFLAEQWERVGAAGVLAIAVVYALLFGVAARWLLDRGFRTAAAMATLLTVCTAPLAAWAILELAHWWPIPTRRSPIDELRWIPVELALVVAALVALRRVRFALLALPVTAGLWLALMHVRVLLREPSTAWLLDPYLGLVGGTLFVAAAYHLDRWQVRTGTREDYAFWPYLAGGISLVIAFAALWDDAPLVPHAALAVALLAIAIAVRIERRTFLALGAIGVLAYLAHLADAFRRTALFPVVLAAIGGVVIGATVWLQRRHPELVRGRRAHQRRPLPGGQRGPLAALALAIVLAFWAWTRVPAWEARAAAERREAVRRSAAPRPERPPPTPPR